MQAHKLSMQITRPEDCTLGHILPVWWSDLEGDSKRAVCRTLLACARERADYAGFLGIQASSRLEHSAYQDVRVCVLFLLKSHMALDKGFKKQVVVGGPCGPDYTNPRLY